MDSYLDPRRVAQYGPAVLNVCRQHLSNTELAMEAYQETFLAYAKQRDTLDHSRSLKPWFKETARRCSLATSRRESRYRGHGALEEPCATEPDQSSAAEHAELLLLVMEEFEALPGQQRDLLRMVYQEGMSHREVSHRVGCPLGSIHSRVETARRQLQRKLSQRGVAISTILLMFLLADNAEAGMIGGVRQEGRRSRSTPRGLPLTAAFVALAVLWFGASHSITASDSSVILPAVAQAEPCAELEELCCVGESDTFGEELPGSGEPPDSTSYPN